MFRRLVEAWLRVAEIRAEAEFAKADARVKAARLRAKALRYAAKVQGGLIAPPPPLPPPVPPAMAAHDAWAAANLEPGKVRDDVRGMMEVVVGVRDASSEKRQRYISRLTRLGVPLPGEDT